MRRFMQYKQVSPSKGYPGASHGLQKLQTPGATHGRTLVTRARYYFEQLPCKCPAVKSNGHSAYTAGGAVHST